MKPKQKQRTPSEEAAKLEPAGARGQGPNLGNAWNVPPKGLRRRWALKLTSQILGRLFLLFHVVAITSWSLPHGAPGIENGQEKGNLSEELLAYNDLYLRQSPIQLYILSTGLWQSWDMFAPNPANSDIYADALVYYKNGDVYQFNYPRMYSLPLIAKYEEERYRKFFEHAGSDTEKYLDQPFAERVARLCTRGPNNPIVKVVLRRHWYQIPAPPSFPQYSENLWKAILKGNVASTDIIAPAPPHPTAYNTYSYYTYVPPKQGGA